ncbi:MAG: hypothetical protein ACXW27_13830 [Allosphingosinicella sp.]
MGKDVRITGGVNRRVQVRKAPRGSFGEAARQVFLDHLAGCANVKAAAAAAGVGVTTVYEARRRDPEFARQWAEALEIGVSTLKALLVEKAALGLGYVPGETKVPGPDTIDPWLALELLRLHASPKGARNVGGAPVRRADEKAVAEAILAKLDVLERRLRKQRWNKAA